MALSRFILPFADVGSGIRPSANSQMFFYATGTTTPKDTFNCPDGTTANSNPVISDINGLFPDIFVTGTYKVVLQDKNGDQQWEADPVSTFINSTDSLQAIETTELLILSKSGESIIQTLGYSIEGDSGGATWKKNGVTAQTPSQSPVDLVDILLNDADGDQWELEKPYRASSVGALVGGADAGPSMRALHSLPREAHYDQGQYNITGGVSIPFGSAIKTAGYETEFFFSGMTELTDCFPIVREAVPQRNREVFVGRHKLVLVDSNARYGWSSPEDADIFIREKPHIEIFCQSMAPDRAATVTPFSFESVIRLGDCRSGRIDLYGSGGYNTLIDDAGARVSNGITLGGATGNVGVKMKTEFLAAHTGLNLIDGVEGFQIEGEFAQVIVGVDSSSQTLVEPGGFIDNMHVNARDAGYRLKNRAEMSIGQASAYKSDAFFDDGVSEWIGFDMQDQTSAKIGSAGAYPGVTFNKSRNTAIKFADGSYSSCVNFVESRNCAIIADIGAVDSLAIQSASSVNGFTGYNITGEPKAVALGPIRESSTPLITNFLIMSGTVNRDEVTYSQDAVQIEAYATRTISAAGTIELKPIIDSMEQNFIVTSGTGAYTYDILLSDLNAAVLGTKFVIKISMPSNTNPTVRVLRKSTLAVLDVFNVAASIRLIAEYQYTTLNTFETRGILESVETTY